MTTQEAIMTTKEVADRFTELAQTNQWEKIQDELFASNAVSIEPPQSPGLQTAEGIDAIKQKGKQFGEMVEEVHGGYTSPAVVGGNFFSIAMGMDCTMKGMGRMKLDEIALYEVKDGKIVREQFFY
jgi:hypothetical protein